jgi:hypothetical protein
MRKLIILALFFIPATIQAAPPLRDSLYAVLIDGTDKYNGGDVDGCRAAYRKALEAARPQLTSRGDLLLAVDDALKSDDPFVLREAIDLVRKAHKPVASMAAPVPLPPDPRLCTHCICGCTETGTCKCQDCDHPALAPIASTSSTSRFWRVWPDGSRTPCDVSGHALVGSSMITTVTNCQNGVCSQQVVNPNTQQSLYLDSGGRMVGPVQTSGYGDPGFQAFMAGSSGGCANGSCGQSAGSTGLFGRRR